GLVSALRTAGRQADPLEYHVCLPEQGLGWRPLCGPFRLVLSEGEAGPRSRCLTRPGEHGEPGPNPGQQAPAVVDFSGKAEVFLPRRQIRPGRLSIWRCAVLRVSRGR